MYNVPSESTNTVFRDWHPVPKRFCCECALGTMVFGKSRFETPLRTSGPSPICPYRLFPHPENTLRFAESITVWYWPHPTCAAR